MVKIELSSRINRSDMKPPRGMSYKRDNRKRAYSEDDELDPMDPSSYSDAPRGGWYVLLVSFLAERKIIFLVLSICS